MKHPIYTEFNLDAKVGVSKLIAVTHTDDRNADVLEVSVRQNGAHIDLTGATAIARMVLHKDRDYLLSDSVPCTVSDSGNILIPFDSAVVPVQKGVIKIEVNLTQADSVLTLQFPLWVSVNGSILDDAEVTPESEGTIPDLLKEAADALEDAEEALERLGSYSNLSDKPQINGVTLNGNKTPAALGLQKTLTAGAHISINQADGVIEGFEIAGYKIVFESQNDRCNEDGTIYSTSIDGQPAVMLVRNSTTHITQFALVKGGQLIWRYQQAETSWQPAGEWSAWEEIGGADDYNDLSNKPTINGKTLRAYPMDNDVDYLGLQKKLFDGIQESEINRAIEVGTSKDNGFYALLDSHDVFNGSVLFQYAFYGYYPIVGSTYGQYNFVFYQFKFPRINTNGEITEPLMYRISVPNIDGSLRRVVTDWTEIGGGSQIVSGVVNQNGTITFTDSDGNTFTTTGSSVIGPQGAPGNDYVLTAQDKADIADIVLQSLPTTQGVLYGNTSN